MAADAISDGTEKKLMTAAERTKLSGIAAGAEVNQNAFSSIAVGATTIAADSKTDTLTLVAGDGITLTADATADSVEIEETYVDACIVTTLANIPANLRNGGLVVLKH